MPAQPQIHNIRFTIINGKGGLTGCGLTGCGLHGYSLVSVLL